MNSPYLHLLLSALLIIPTFIVMIGCIIYIERRRSFDGVLMLIGQVATIFLALASLGVRFLTTADKMNMSAKLLRSFYLIAPMISLIAACIFAGGFLFMAIRAKPLSE